MHLNLRMATTASRGFRTPYEMITGEVPSLTALRPFNTETAVTVPKSKRQKMIDMGRPLERAEVGRLIAYQSPYALTPCIMLNGNRMVHSRNVTYTLDNYVISKPLEQQSTKPLDDQSTE